MLKSKQNAIKNFRKNHIEKSQGPLLKNLSFGHSPLTHAPLFGQAHRASWLYKSELLLHNLSWIREYNIKNMFNMDSIEINET